MSLITEALQLRKANPRGRGSGGESFPPLRRTPPATKVILLIVLSCGVGVFLFWKGAWVLEKLEGVAGIHFPVPAMVAGPAATPAVPAGPSVEPVSPPVPAGVDQGKPASLAAPPETSEGAARPVAAQEEKTAALPEELQPMDVNLSLALIEDEKARQQLDEENQRKIEGFLGRLDIQGVCHQGENSTALLDSVLVRPGDAVGDLGLKLKLIQPRRMVFADRNGREYFKSY